MSREPYEAPEAREMSVEEMLTEAQQCVDKLFARHRAMDAKMSDLKDVLDAITEELETIEKDLTAAERAVQRVSYVAAHLPKGEHDASTRGPDHSG